jgi:hypothetical protein
VVQAEVVVANPALIREAQEILHQQHRAKEIMVVLVCIPLHRMELAEVVALILQLVLAQMERVLLVVMAEMVLLPHLLAHLLLMLVVAVVVHIHLEH